MIRCLRNSVDYVNQIDGLFFPATLFVSGVVLTGEIIGPEEFFRMYANYFGSPVFSDGTPNLAYERALSIGTNYRADYLARRQRADATGGPFTPEYVHLRAARVISGQGLVPQGIPMLWRGRIAAVDGFAIGSLGGSPGAPP